MELDKFEAAVEDKKTFMRRITLVKQDFSGVKANTISPIQNIGCLRFRDTRQ
jgi:hypothetical protein